MKTARARFEEALELAPELVAALSGMTMVEANEGNHRQAMALAARILAVDPRNLRALRARFNAAVALGDQTEIDLALEALAKEDPDALVGQLFERAISSFNQNQLEAAKEELERVLQLAEDHSSAHYYLGLCLVNLGDEQQAKEHFRRFLELDPSSEDAEMARQMLDHLQ